MMYNVFGGALKLTQLSTANQQLECMLQLECHVLSLVLRYRSVDAHPPGGGWRKPCVRCLSGVVLSNME